MRKTKISTSLYSEACDYLVGGVNSPVRAFLAVKTSPIMAKKVAGAYLIDADNNRFIDYCSSWGASILGHSHRIIKNGIKKALKNGLNYGFTHENEVNLASLLCEAIPSMGKIRFVSSGTEAVMSAVRLARAYTCRDVIVKFDGCYHGHSDSMLVAAGSGLLTFLASSSKGVPSSIAEKSVSIPFNDRQAVKGVFDKYKDQIAAVIVEPIPANMGVVLPEEGFLQFLRDVTKANGAVLIFDEVITGFRFAFGGAQKLFGVTPDLTCLGKIIGGGMSVAAFGGKREIMERLSPLGDVYQAGTLSGNPVAVSAGCACIDYLKNNQWIYDRLKTRTDYLLDAIDKKGIVINNFGSMWTIFFNSIRVKNYNDVKKSDTVRFAEFYRHLLDNGVLFPPSQFEACFLTDSHAKREIDRTVDVINKSIAVIG